MPVDEFDDHHLWPPDVERERLEHGVLGTLDVDDQELEGRLYPRRDEQLVEAELRYLDAFPRMDPLHPFDLLVYLDLLLQFGAQPEPDVEVDETCLRADGTVGDQHPLVGGVTVRTCGGEARYGLHVEAGPTEVRQPRRVRHGLAVIRTDFHEGAIGLHAPEELAVPVGEIRNLTG